MEMNDLTPAQSRAVAEAARKLNAAGVDFVLIAGEDGRGALMSNMCPHCAVGLLGGALAGAMSAAGGRAMSETLQ